ncbi:MAG: PAS-domain containing protein [Alphaproteobacteria bacterium]|nr:PAS-domain containing protein [Alphaproteobacteria bacterium]
MERFKTLSIDILEPILDSIFDAVCLYDAEDKVLYWNNRYLEYFPWHKDGMFVGRSYRDALRVFFESNLSSGELENIEFHLEEGVKRHQNLKHPFSFQTRLGRWLTVHPFRLDNGMYLKIWRETTPVPETSESYRHLLDTITAINIGFACFDRTGHFILNNYKLSEILPESIHLFSNGRSFEEFLDGCCQESLKGGDKDIIDFLKSRTFPILRGITEPVSLTTKFGLHIEYEECVTAEGGLICILSDVTARELTERRLRESETQARAAHAQIQQFNRVLEDQIEERTQELTAALNAAHQSNEAKTRLLANVSHELRTPLNAIIGFSEILTGEGDFKLDLARSQEYARHIFSSAEYLRSLIDYILQMSAADTRSRNLPVTEISVEAIFEKCQTLLMTTSANSNVHIDFKIADDVKTVLGTQQCILQILLNVGANSIRYTPPEGTLHFEAKNGSPGTIKIIMTDSGCGMPPEQLANLSDPFSNDQWTRTDPKRGAGIGIPLSMMLAKEMGGELSYQSKLGVGTTATLILPTPESP